MLISQASLLEGKTIKGVYEIDDDIAFVCTDGTYAVLYANRFGEVELSDDVPDYVLREISRLSGTTYERLAEAERQRQEQAEQGREKALLQELLEKYSARIVVD